MLQTYTEVSQNGLATLEIYRRILNFNFVGKYDPKLKSILYQVSHAVVYKFNQQIDNWEKLDFEGTLIYYERNVDDVDADGNVVTALHYLTYDELRLKDNYKYGMIIANRKNPKNISLGVIPKSITSKYSEFYRGNSYEVQVDNDILMLKNCLGEIYGIWMHNATERDALKQLIQLAIDS